MKVIGGNLASTDHADLTKRGLAGVMRSRFARAVLFAVAPLLMHACANSGTVAEQGSRGRYSLHASAAGGSTAWARSHKAVVQRASDFCAQRGQMLSVVSESSTGVRALERHEAELTFECHARFSQE